MNQAQFFSQTTSPTQNPKILGNSSISEKIFPPATVQNIGSNNSNTYDRSFNQQSFGQNSSRIRNFNYVFVGNKEQLQGED